jgi:hypothetical protein
MRLASLLAVAAVAATTLAAVPARHADPVAMTVYRSESCGCCKKWEEHMRKHGFTVTSVVQDDLSQIKAESGVTANLRSCHTALVGGYVIEGHVPAEDVQRLLKEKPKVIGLTAPGMPQSSPGMDIGKEPYEVLTFDAKGKTAVWAKH